MLKIVVIPHPDIFEYRQIIKEPYVLKCSRNPNLINLKWWKFCNVNAGKIYAGSRSLAFLGMTREIPAFAGMTYLSHSCESRNLRFINPGQKIKDAGFSGTVRSNKPYELPLIQIQIKIIYSTQSTEFQSAARHCEKIGHEMISSFSSSSSVSLHVPLSILLAVAEKISRFPKIPCGLTIIITINNKE